jgi:hypothetical protein
VKPPVGSGDQCERWTKIADGDVESEGAYGSLDTAQVGSGSVGSRRTNVFSIAPLGTKSITSVPLLAWLDATPTPQRPWMAINLQRSTGHNADYHT